MSGLTRSRSGSRSRSTLENLKRSVSGDDQTAGFFWGEPKEEWLKEHPHYMKQNFSDKLVTLAILQLFMMMANLLADYMTTDIKITNKDANMLIVGLTYCGGVIIIFLLNKILSYKWRSLVFFLIVVTPFVLYFVSKYFFNKYSSKKVQHNLFDYAVLGLYGIMSISLSFQNLYGFAYGTSKKYGRAGTESPSPEYGYRGTATIVSDRQGMESALNTAAVSNR